jgi:phosphopantetheinyl transferase (holo-ACP synthase)
MYDVVIEKEYTKLSLESKKPVIGCLMMVKNEHARIHVTLDSITGVVDCLIIYDTGSTDDTMKIIIEHCEKHKLNLYMIQGEFVNFSVSRNISLDYADTKNVHFLLLLDVNDELRGGDKLKKFAENELETDNNAYLTCQYWWSGQYNKYFNTRFIRARKNWRYKGSVHEWIEDTNEIKGNPVVKMSDDIILYQDRTKDDDKTGKRFHRDKELLLEDYKKDPKHTRTVFYLAQTYACLKENNEAFKYYKIRSELEGFYEEKFYSYLKCGEISEKLGYDWYESMSFYMKSLEIISRVEPLVKIAEHYRLQKKWFLAYQFIQSACSLKYPDHCILFVDTNSYDYLRWHNLGIIAYYVGKFKEGKEACLKAIKTGINVELNKKNLKFYDEKEKEEEINENKSTLTKNEFIKTTILELQKQNTKMTMKQMKKLALCKWKKRNI